MFLILCNTHVLLRNTLRTVAPSTLIYLIPGYFCQDQHYLKMSSKHTVNVTEILVQTNHQLLPNYQISHAMRFKMLVCMSAVSKTLHQHTRKCSYDCYDWKFYLKYSYGSYMQTKPADLESSTESFQF